MPRSIANRITATIARMTLLSVRILICILLLRIPLNLSLSIPNMPQTCEEIVNKSRKCGEEPRPVAGVLPRKKPLRAFSREELCLRPRNDPPG
jgi:hypothetical protein